jgi:hypothetical protein
VFGFRKVKERFYESALVAKVLLRVKVIKRKRFNGTSFFFEESDEVERKEKFISNFQIGIFYFILTSSFGP